MPDKQLYLSKIFTFILVLGMIISSNICHADGLVINEIVARDAYGGNDWIELYAVGSDYVYLSNYMLSDDDEERAPVRLPAVKLYPGEFIVIPATDENPNDGTFYLPFKLGADDCVTLYKYQGMKILDVLDWNSGDAPAGYSYGRFPDGTGLAQTLLPTPNSANEAPLPSDLIINEVLARDAQGGNDWIELYVAGAGPVCLGDYSLTDDDEGRAPAPLPDITLSTGEFIVIKATNEIPSDGSYYVPFKLGSEDCVILYQGSDMVDVLDWSDGEAPIGCSYGRHPDGVTDNQLLIPTPGESNKIFEVFQTNTVIDVKIDMYKAAWQDILDNPSAEFYQLADITYNGALIENVAVRTKGNSSLMTVARDPNNDRYSLKVDINRYIQGQDLVGIQKLNLNNGFSDPTFMRDYLSYHLMREMGVPAPRCAFANLYVNDELMGLYTVVEAIDDEFVELHFDQGDGDLYKAEMGSHLLGDPNGRYEYTGLELKTNEDTSDQSTLISMLDELNYGGDYESVLDVDEVLRYFAVNTVLVSLDSYQGSMGHNYYLYEENGIFRILPWDYNMSFGTFSMSCEGEEITKFMIDEPTIGEPENRPLIANLLDVPEYLEIYHGYLNDIITGPFAPAIMNQIIDETANLIRPHVYADPSKFYTSEDFEETLTDDLTVDPNDVSLVGFNRGFGIIIGLKTFIAERVESIRKQLDGKAPASNDGMGNCPNPWDYIDMEDPIEKVSPSSAILGTSGIKVTIRIDNNLADLLSEYDADLESVTIGTTEGYDLDIDDDEVTAVFNFPITQMAGMQSVSITFEVPDDFAPPMGGFGNMNFRDFNPEDFGGWGGGGMPPGGMPFGGMPPGGFGNWGDFDPADFEDWGGMAIGEVMMDDDELILTKSEAFQITGSIPGVSMTQTGYGYGAQSLYGFMPSGYGYPGQTGFGYSSQGLYGYGMQAGYGYSGLFPQSGYGYGIQTGYPLQQGYSGIYQGGYPMQNTFFPQSGYGYGMQTGYPSQGFPGIYQGGYPMQNWFMF